MRRHRRRPPASDKRYVTARSTMQTVGTSVGPTDAGVVTQLTLWPLVGAATNRATIPLCYTKAQDECDKEMLCARAVVWPWLTLYPEVYV